MPLRLNWQVLVQRKTKKIGYFEFLIFIIIPCIAFCACYYIKRTLILEIQSPNIWILWHFRWYDHFTDFKQKVFKHHSLNSDYSIISKTKSLEACERQHEEYLAIVTSRTDNWETICEDHLMTWHRTRMGLAHGEKGSLELQKISQRSAENHGVNLRVANKRKINQQPVLNEIHVRVDFR